MTARIVEFGGEMKAPAPANPMTIYITQEMMRESQITRWILVDGWMLLTNAGIVVTYTQHKDMNEYRITNKQIKKKELLNEGPHNWNPAQTCYDTHEGKVADHISNHWTLSGADSRNWVVRDANLEEGRNPNDGDDKQGYERYYLEFDVVAELDERQGKDEHESDLFAAQDFKLRTWRTYTMLTK